MACPQYFWIESTQSQRLETTSISGKNANWVGANPSSATNLLVNTDNLQRCYRSSTSINEEPGINIPEISSTLEFYKWFCSCFSCQ